MLSLPDNMFIYDDVDEEVMHSFHEASLANMIFFAMKEGACSEQSSRMTAMDAATKSAGKVLLSLFNDSSCVYKSLRFLEEPEILLLLLLLL